MFCKNCGKEINNNAVICIHCGCGVADENNKKVENSKAGLGVLFALLLGLIGLIIGICLYPQYSFERKTYIKAWSITFCVTIIIGVVGIIFLFLINPYILGLIANLL